MPRLIGIDLGSHAVKVTVMRSSSRRHELEARHHLPVPQDDEHLPPIAARLAVLADVVSHHPEWQHPSNDVAIAWPNCTARRITLPFTDKANIDKTLSFAVEAEVPFDLEEMILASRVLSVEDQTKLLVFLAPQAGLSGAFTALKGMKTDPRYAFPTGEVIAAYAGPERVIAVVDVGHAHTVVSVVREGVAHMTRTIDHGGRTVTLALQQALGIDYAAAERLKCGGREDLTETPTREEALAAWESLSDPARQAANDAMGLLLAEVRSTLVAAEDRFDLDIDEVRLVGGGARLAPLAEYLAADLGVQVVRPSGLDRGSRADVYDISDALVARLQGRTSGKEVDLRVGPLAFRGGVDVLKATVVYGGFGLVFFALAALVVFGIRYRTLSVELKTTEDRVVDLVTQTLPHVDPSVVRDTTIAKTLMKEEVGAAVARAELLGGESSVPPTIDTLAALTKAFPEPEKVKVDVTELTITPLAIQFTGETDSYASADAVTASIQQVPRFSRAEKGNEKTIRDRVSFPVSIPVGDVEEEAG